VVILQEDIEQRSIVLATKTTRMTGQVLATLMKASYNKIQRVRHAPKVGKQSIRSLAKGGTLDNIEITNDNIKAFEPYARKFGISYALQKDTSENPPKWLVFFKSKDTASMTAAFRAFTATTLNQQQSKPSVKEAIVKFQELIKNTVRNITKNKTHGEHEI